MAYENFTELANSVKDYVLRTTPGNFITGLTKAGKVAHADRQKIPFEDVLVDPIQKAFIAYLRSFFLSETLDTAISKLDALVDPLKDIFITRELHDIARKYNDDYHRAWIVYSRIRKNNKTIEEFFHSTFAGEVRVIFGYEFPYVFAQYTDENIGSTAYPLIVPTDYDIYTDMDPPDSNFQVLLFEYDVDPDRAYRKYTDFVRNEREFLILLLPARVFPLMCSQPHFTYDPRRFVDYDVKPRPNVGFTVENTWFEYFGMDMTADAVNQLYNEVGIYNRTTVSGQTVDNEINKEVLTISVRSENIDGQEVLYKDYLIYSRAKFNRIVFNNTYITPPGVYLSPDTFIVNLDMSYFENFVDYHNQYMRFSIRMT